MTLTVVSAPQFSLTRPPGVVVTATSSVSTASDFIDVWRIHEDSTEHRVLTGPRPRLSGGAWIGIDYHAPFNQPVTYRVVGSETGTAPAVWVSCPVTWLVHPSLPELSVEVEIVTVLGDRARASRATRFEPLDAPVVFRSSGRRNGVVASIEVAVSRAAVQDLVDLLDDDTVLLINTPGDAKWDVKWMWVQPGTVTDSTFKDAAKADWRTVTFPFEQCADPDVDSVGITCGEAATFAATCGAYAALYANCGYASIDKRL